MVYLWLILAWMAVLTGLIILYLKVLRTGGETLKDSIVYYSLAVWWPAVLATVLLVGITAGTALLIPSIIEFVDKLIDRVHDEEEKAHDG